MRGGSLKRAGRVGQAIPSACPTPRAHSKWGKITRTNGSVVEHWNLAVVVAASDL